MKRPTPCRRGGPDPASRYCIKRSAMGCKTVKRYILIPGRPYTAALDWTPAPWPAPIASLATMLSPWPMSQPAFQLRCHVYRPGHSDLRLGRSCNSGGLRYPGLPEMRSPQHTHASPGWHLTCRQYDCTRPPRTEELSHQQRRSLFRSYRPSLSSLERSPSQSASYQSTMGRLLSTAMQPVRASGSQRTAAQNGPAPATTARAHRQMASMVCQLLYMLPRVEHLQQEPPCCTSSVDAQWYAGCFGSESSYISDSSHLATTRRTVALPTAQGGCFPRARG